MKLSDMLSDMKRAKELKKIIPVMRDKIIARLPDRVSDGYELATLYWGDAARWFPSGRDFDWDMAVIKLNLRTGKLYGELSTYPNQFGACREERAGLRAEDFHTIATRHDYSKELQLFQTDADWALLFDEKLKAAVEEQVAREKKADAERARQMRLRNAVKIPARFADQKPTMELTMVNLQLYLMYGGNGVTVTQENQRYQIEYTGWSNLSSNNSKHTSVLSDAEAAWLEQQVRDALNNPDKTVWKSLPGGEMMTVEILTQQEICVDLKHKAPLQKYFDLHHSLGKLAEYGGSIQTGTK